MYLKIAHRGASGYERENTLRAFEKAIELGADMVELDIHLSRDGIPVVLHGSHLEAQPIAEMTLNQIKQIDADVPTLQEVSDCVKGRCGLYIELKGAGTEEPVVSLVRRNGIHDQVIVASFDPQKVRRIREIDPGLETSILFSDKEVDFVALARESRADCVHLCWERYPTPHQLLTDALMQRAAAHGLKVVIWHEERPDEIREIIKQPIYGICSNLPDLLGNGG